MAVPYPESSARDQAACNANRSGWLGEAGSHAAAATSTSPCMRADQVAQNGDPTQVKALSQTIASIGGAADIALRGVPTPTWPSSTSRAKASARPSAPRLRACRRGRRYRRPSR